MKKFLALVAFLFSFEQIAIAAPLQTWPQWVTQAPYISKQVPPNAMIMRGQGTDNYYVLEVDPATGEIPVSLAGAGITIDFSGVTGDPVPGHAGYVGGIDDNGDLQGLHVDTSGNLQVDIGGTNFDFGASSGGIRTASLLGVGTTAVSNANPVPISDAGGTITVDGNVNATNFPATVDTNSGAPSASTIRTVLSTRSEAAATPLATRQSDGTNFSLTSDLTAAQQTLSTGNALPVTKSIGMGWDGTNHRELAVTTTGAVQFTQAGKAYSDSARNDYTSVNVTTGAWVQIIASTAAAFSMACITDQSGQIMELGSGAAASETRIFLIARGFSGCIPLTVASGTRLSLRAVSGTASTGDFVISGMN